MTSLPKTENDKMEIDFNKIAQINLIKGAGGGNPQAGLCIMEMVSYFDGADRVTDHPACACPFLTDIAITINDRAPSQEERDTLKPLLPLLTGSLDPDSRKARDEFAHPRGASGSPQSSGPRDTDSRRDWPKNTARRSRGGAQ